MRLAVISDIHGNLEALEAVLLEIDRLSVDGVVALGDIVGSAKRRLHVCWAITMRR
jgi:predicted phosphodiesterase